MGSKKKMPTFFFIHSFLQESIQKLWIFHLTWPICLKTIRMTVKIAWKSFPTTTVCKINKTPPIAPNRAPFINFVYFDYNVVANDLCSLRWLASRNCWQRILFLRYCVCTPRHAILLAIYAWLCAQRSLLPNDLSSCAALDRTSRCGVWTLGASHCGRSLRQRHRRRYSWRGYVVVWRNDAPEKSKNLVPVISRHYRRLLSFVACPARPTLDVLWTDTNDDSDNDEDQEMREKMKNKKKKQDGAHLNNVENLYELLGLKEVAEFATDNDLKKACKQFFLGGLLKKNFFLSSQRRFFFLFFVATFYTYRNTSVTRAECF